LAFCFAPQFHPAVRNLAALRRRLRVATLFNWLGPLANPAGAPYQLLGVGRPELLDLVAGALARLGTIHALVVCGRDGLDEVSLSGITDVREVRGQSVIDQAWSPTDFGLASCDLADLRADGAAESAAIILALLSNHDGPPLRIVLANAAAALLAAERVTSLRDGVSLAREAIANGKAAQVLQTLQGLSPAAEH